MSYDIKPMLRRLLLLIALSLSSGLFAVSSASIQVQQGQNLYSDEAVETFVERFPSLQSEYNEVPTPEDILQQLEIDINALESSDRYIGDCLDIVVYTLSPSYDLVVDDNACSGFNVYVRRR